MPKKAAEKIFAAKMREALMLALSLLACQRVDRDPLALRAPKAQLGIPSRSATRRSALLLRRSEGNKKK